MPGTTERGRPATLRGPHRHHPTARMPGRRSAFGLQEVPDPRAGTDAGGARGPGVTGAGPLRAVSPGAAADGRPFDLDHILAVARSVGLDAERLARDMEAPALDALIARNAILANALGVRGTPVFVIGVVERPLLTLCNAARSIDYRADRHRTYAPINIHGRPAPTVTGERTGERAALPQRLPLMHMAPVRFTFAASPRVGPISRFMTRSAMPSRSVASRFRMTRVEPDSLASVFGPEWKAGLVDFHQARQATRRRGKRRATSRWRGKGRRQASRASRASSHLVLRHRLAEGDRRRLNLNIWWQTLATGAMCISGSRFMTRSAMPSRSVASRFRMTRVEPDSLASTGNPAAG